MIVFDIEEELKKLPEKPGVYLMHSSTDEIIYVGKAIILKNRVRQYFQSSRNKSAKIKEMVSNIAYFEYIITDSEMEALVLECNLIKEYRPHYNTMLKDSKGYPYIQITTGESFPRIATVYTMKRDKNRYFGPYPSVGAVKDTIELIHKLFQLRTCSRVLPRDTKKQRPCLNYHMKRCSAPCQGYISKEEYRKKINQVIDLLNGKYEQIVSLLEEQMTEAAEQMEFEEAAKYRDLIKSVKQVSQRQKIIDHSMQDRDIIAMASDDRDAIVQVFFVREGKMLGRDHFHLTAAQGESEKTMLSSFVKQFYSGTPFIPRELFLQEEIEDKGLIEEWLTQKRGKKVSVLIPKKGEKERLVELAKKNAALLLEQDKEKIQKEEKRTIGALNQVAGWMELSEIHRIEAYDISNISGFESVGSMIVYEDGKPKRNDYRKFKIRSVQGPNDYASMREILLRRFAHGIEEQKEGTQEEFGRFTRFPDLIMMDGGKGQVNIAIEVLRELNQPIPVCGLVKDDHHRTRGIYYNNKEIAIDVHSEGFHFITRVQDEAHRFAIEYHRSLRKKGTLHSILDDVPGIGEKRRKALMRKFGDIGAIKAASLEELILTDGMNKRAAESVYQFFRHV